MISLMRVKRIKCFKRTSNCGFKLRQKNKHKQAQVTSLSARHLPQNTPRRKFRPATEGSCVRVVDVSKHTKETLEDVLALVEEL